MTEKDSVYKGVIMIRGKGTGFVTLPGFDEDVIIVPEALNTALDGDIVELELGPKVQGERQSAEVRNVLERARSEYIGIVEEEEGRRYLKPDSRRIHRRFLLPDAPKDALGMKVAVELVSWKKGEERPTGRIVETLGRAGDHETEMQAIIRGGGFALDFPPDVQKEAEELFKNHEKFFELALKDEKRRDFRDVPTCTIDPKDAKDFDDALSFRTLENGNIEVGIHIADVSTYVVDGSAIDLEARERGTSIYLVDRVIPMLPEVLSNDLCSLRPNEDRLAFSAVFELDEGGGVVNEWFGQTVIHSDRRFSYEEAQDILDVGKGEMHEALATLMERSRKIRRKRYQSGSMAFEQPEVKFELDEKGKPTAIYLKHRTETMLMIEDYMLLANRRVAEYVHKLSKGSGRDAAFVYRIHDTPDPDKIEELSIFLHALGYEFKTKKGLVEQTDINKLLREVEGTPEENLIKTATIRSMAKAVYSTKNIGHFSLAFKYYTHFTSPIRRYPDLMAHRLLRKHLDGSPIGPKELARYEQLSVQSSEREMHAVSAERDSIKFKQVEYMKEKIGETFDGVITGVTDWGIYVEEKKSRAEGMVPLAAIKSDYFTSDPKSYSVKGEKTNARYRLGDEVRVKLVNADVNERKLDFVLA